VAGEERNGFKLLGDQPCVEENDALDFGKIARELSDLILASSTSTPFTIGIEGTWGEGKSSLMGRIERELERKGKPVRAEWWARLWRWFRKRRPVKRLIGWLDSRWPIRWLRARGWRWRTGRRDSRLTITTVRFNAWTAGEEDVLEGLVKSVLDELDESILRHLAWKDKLISWFRALMELVVHALGLGSVVNRVWDKLAADPTARNQIRDLMSAALEDWGDQERGGGNRLLVVFIDDLDRCHPHGVFQVFEAMKLYLDAPKLVFVVGFDPGMVSEAVLKEKGYDLPEIDDYLAKVIQTRFEIPPTERDQGKLLMEHCMTHSGTAGVFDDEARALVLDRNDYNPRRVKRFINSFILEYQLGNRDRLGSNTLIWVLILKFYFPRFVEWLRQSRPEDDLLGEFIGYVKARNVLLKRDAPTRDEVESVTAFLRNYDPDARMGVLPAEKAKNLRSLEDALPEDIPRLVAEDRRLSNLIPDLDKRVSSRQVLMRALRRRPIVEPSLAGSGEDEPGGDKGGRRRLRADAIDDSGAESLGLDVLWITDDDDADSAHMLRLKGSGVNVRLAHDLEEARRMLTERSPDALLSDTTRHGDPNAGLRDLRAILDDDLYDGPILLFTARVTPVRRREASDLNVGITSSWHDVFNRLRRVAGERTPG
jgi:hypothetical protein